MSTGSKSRRWSLGSWGIMPAKDAPATCSAERQKIEVFLVL
jgi:hypothetical protein